MATRAAVAAAVAAALTTLAACGGGGAGGQTPHGAGGSSAGGGSHLITIDVGVLPITSVAPLELGIKKGFFRQDGLKVRTHVAQGGAALVPAVVSGQYQFSFSNNVSLIIARSKGLPVRIVVAANSIGSDPSPSEEALVVPEGSPVTSVGQLQGKTIALNTLDNTEHLADLITLAKAGVDTSKVHFVEIGFPDMPQALRQHRVDAADIVAPFLGVVKKSGGRVLAKPYRVIRQNLYISSWFTNESYMSSHEKTVRKFARAIERSNKYAESHSEELRRLVPTYLKIDAATAQHMALAHFPAGCPKPKVLERLAKDSVRFHFIKHAPRTSDLLSSASCGKG